MRYNEIMESVNFQAVKCDYTPDYPDGICGSAFPRDWHDEYDTKHPDYHDYVYGDSEVEPPRNPTYRSDLEMSMVEGNFKDMMAALGYSRDDNNIPIDEFIAVATQWLQGNIGKLSKEEPDIQDRNFYQGGKREGYLNEKIKKALMIAREGKSHGATHVGAW